MEPPKPEPESVATALAPSSGQPIVPPAKAPPSKRLVLLAGIGVLVALVASIAIVTIVLPADEQVASKPTDPPGPPGPNPTIVKKGEATAASLREEALEYLDKAYAQQNGGKSGTREEALQFLDKVYAQQLAQQQAQAADEPDPDAVFAVDIKAALAAGQVEGANSATVTVVEAWDFA